MQYRAYIGGGRYREHLKLTAPLLVLDVTIDETLLRKILALTEQQAGAAGSAYHLFQSWDAFGALWRPPDPRLELLYRPWLRAGQMPYLIDGA